MMNTMDMALKLHRTERKYNELKQTFQQAVGLYRAEIKRLTEELELHREKARLSQGKPGQ